MNCDYCHETFVQKKKGQRFCTGKGCRQKWHRQPRSPGEVTGLRALKRGGWSVTIKYDKQPQINIGTKVSLKTDV